MAEASKLKPCTYFLVQYVPDVTRGELLNIGVFLHSPEEGFLDCLFTDDFHRLKRFHPQADTEFLRELQPHFEQQIKEHEGDLDGYIREMQEAFSNLIQVTPPRTCLVAEPQAIMADLFARYVGARLAGPPPQDTRMRIKQRLTAALRRSGVLEHSLFEKRVPAERWTQKGDPFCFDFGYRPLQVEGKPNGHVKLIHAYSFGRDPDKEVVKALRWTFDRVLEKELAEITVGHEDLVTPIDPTARASQSILQGERIHLVPASRFDDYAQSVHVELLGSG
jgi:hypothetical protein